MPDHILALDQGTTSSRAIAHLVLIAVSLVLAIGMSWSHVSRKMSGQMDTDNVG